MPESALPSPLRASALVTPVRARWEFAPDGPPAWLSGRRPVASAAVGGLRLRFGPRSDPGRPAEG